MAQELLRPTTILGLTLALCACGGDDTGGVAYIPPPPPPPAPAPDPNPSPPPMPADAIGLTGGPFSTYTVATDGTGNVTAGVNDFQISYSADDNVYTVSGPGLEQGHLIGTTIGSGSWMTGGTTWSTISYTSSFVSRGDTEVPQENGLVSLDWANAPYSESDLRYTSFGSWAGADNRGGSFVYGVPTAVGDVPVTGTADYSGDIRGMTSGDGNFWGSIGLEFDFGSGTLSGSMSPVISYADGWDSIGLGTYTFHDTVYSRGGTSFSGAFAVPGSDADSSFQGNFNGPGGVEVMGNFSAPYQSPNTQQWGTMTGVFGARQKP